MEQRVFIKIAFEDGLAALETHRKLVEHYGGEALSYPSVTYWRREFRMGRQDVEDSPKTGRPPDFGIRLRIESALAAFPNGSVRSIAELTGYEPSTVFYILTQVLHLKFRHWRWTPTHSQTIKKSHVLMVQTCCEPNFSWRGGGIGICFGRVTNRGFFGTLRDLDLGLLWMRNCP